MKNNNSIVAIDLGSSSVTVAAANKTADGRLNIIDLVSKPLEGMSAGEITNIEQVTTAIRQAVSELEEHTGLDVREAYTGISGREIKCADSSYFVYVSGEDHEICKEDVQKLHESMNSLQPPEGICILDRIPQKYVIDSREETMQPVGRFGQQLEATFNFILGCRSSLDRMCKAFSRLGIAQRRIFTNAQASAAATLTDDEKELGAAVIDIGADCTDICVWKDNIMRYAAVLPIGSGAINNDIRSIAIPERYIEKLKTTHGYATPACIPEELKPQSIKFRGKNSQENKVSFVNLAKIIEARMLDIVENVVEELKDSGYGDKLGAGLVLTGGGSMLKGTDALFRERTKYDVRLGSADVSLLSEQSSEAAADMRNVSVIGLLLLGMEDSGIVPTTETAQGEKPANRKDGNETYSDGKKKPDAGNAVGSRSDETKPVEGDDSTFDGDSGNGSSGKDSGDNSGDPDSDSGNSDGKNKHGKDKKPRKGIRKWIQDIITPIFDVVDDDEIQ